MRIDEVIMEDVFNWEDETAEEIFLADPNGKPRIGAFKPGMQGLDYKLVARKAKGIAGKFPNNQRGAIRHIVDQATNKGPQKSAPTSAPATQKSAPAPAPAPAPQKTTTRGAPPGNKNAFKGGGASGKVTNFAKKFGGIKTGAQPRSRKLGQ